MTDTNQHYMTIGTALVNIDALEQWLSTDEGKDYISNNWSKETNKYHANNWDETKHIEFCSKNIPLFRKAEDLYDKTWGKYRLQDLKDTAMYYNSVGMKFELVYIDKKWEFAIIRDVAHAYLIPTKFLHIEEYKDYEDVSIEKIRTLSGTQEGVGLIPKEQSNMTIKGVKSALSEKQQQIEERKEEIKKLEKQKKEELEEYKRKLEAAYKEKMELLEAKKEELLNMQKELEGQLFLLDSEIYSIRCYNGEAVQFHKLKEGKRGSSDRPVVVYQKIRYLDVELGKYLSIYDFTGEISEQEYFEQILSAREDLRDLFLPAERSVCFIRVSETNTVYAADPICANVLKKYEKYHGKTIGILIRDGEMLYIAWTDEERISLHSANAFLESHTSVSDVDDVPLESSSTKEEVAARYFIYSILQGVFDNGNILPLPEKVSLLKPNNFIVFSYASGWIEDNRFGNFADIVERTSKLPLQKGDMLLTTMCITRDDVGVYSFNSTRNEAYNNNRGRGEKNRTHDVSLSNCTLYPVNYVEENIFFTAYYDKYKVELTEHRTPLSKTSYSYYYDKKKTDILLGQEKRRINIEDGYLFGNKAIRIKGRTAEDILSSGKKYIDDQDDICIERNNDVAEGYYKKLTKLELRGKEIRYYVSEEKESHNITGKSAHCNFEIMSDEYLNLTFLNSVWVRYAINNQKVGAWKIGGKTVDYAYSIKYLNKALQYLDKREKEEAAYIETYMPLYDDWQVDLSEWKMKNNIHYLTPTRAKRFAKEYSKKVEKR